MSDVRSITYLAVYAFCALIVFFGIPALMIDATYPTAVLNRSVELASVVNHALLGPELDKRTDLDFYETTLENRCQLDAAHFMLAPSPIPHARTGTFKLVDCVLVVPTADGGASTARCPYWWLLRKCFALAIPEQLVADQATRRFVEDTIQHPCRLRPESGRSKDQEVIDRAFREIGCGSASLLSPHVTVFVYEHPADKKMWKPGDLRLKDEWRMVMRVSVN
jgi:hypothetical protein